MTTLPVVITGPFPIPTTDPEGDLPWWVRWVPDLFRKLLPDVGNVIVEGVGTLGLTLLGASLVLVGVVRLFGGTTRLAAAATRFAPGLAGTLSRS